MTTHINSSSGWWFGTFFIFHFIYYMGCHPSHWRTPSFFKMVIAPPTSTGSSSFFRGVGLNHQPAHHVLTLVKHTVFVVVKSWLNHLGWDGLKPKKIMGCLPCLPPFSTGDNRISLDHPQISLWDFPFGETIIWSSPYRADGRRLFSGHPQVWGCHKRWLAGTAGGDELRFSSRVNIWKMLGVQQPRTSH